jgi:ADP-ribosylglycohydrolase
MLVNRGSAILLDLAKRHKKARPLDRSAALLYNRANQNLEDQMSLPIDYAERVYAGVLGKIIGVYLGRPFEGWSYERILRELGEIQYYVHEQLGVPLIVVDDDISGTFAFLRAMSDYGNRPDLTPAQIGQTWLNYLIEPKTVLWWGGMGMSTEHTAYLRLKAGIPAPKSGSIALNSQVVAEQIGAQIFIDGWGMIAPGDPERAADYARRAASVSHDGEAIYAAQVVAAMEAQAFVEPSIVRLLDVGQGLIPADCLINRLISDLRDWRGRYATWQLALEQIQRHYGYDRYGGNCHMVPNHALVILALLYCDDRFDRALTIVNTAGWDTDCNSGNVGCLMGIKNGLAGLEVGPDFRTPVADRMYIPTAAGGETVTDAAQEALKVVSIGRALAGEPDEAPKGGARYHFALPGAVQAFQEDQATDSRGVVTLRNVVGHSAALDLNAGARSLAIAYHGVAMGRPARLLAETFPPMGQSKGYGVLASPTLYPGQVVSARLSADSANATTVQAGLVLKTFGADDQLVLTHGPVQALAPGGSVTLKWRLDVPQGCPIAAVGLELTSDDHADGMVYLDWLTWAGAPDVRLGPPEHNGKAWQAAWVLACSSGGSAGGHDYRMVQNQGMGLMMQGTRQWQDYAASATLSPHLAEAWGLAVRVQGLKRYYALQLVPGNRAQLVRELDGTTVLAEAAFDWQWDGVYALCLTCRGDRLVASADGRVLFDLRDASLLTGGAMALLLAEGRMEVDNVCVRPA